MSKLKDAALYVPREFSSEWGEISSKNYPDGTYASILCFYF